MKLLPIHTVMPFIVTLPCATPEDRCKHYAIVRIRIVTVIVEPITRLILNVISVFYSTWNQTYEHDLKKFLVFCYLHRIHFAEHCSWKEQ
jgi:hypothetical protein